MTGPLGPMDDDGVVDLLRAAGRGGADPSPADVSRAMTAGRKIRRRRQTMQVVGSGLAIAAVLAVGITTVSSLDGGPGRDTVASQPDDATPAPALPAAGSALDYLAEDLGDGWTVSDDAAILDPARTSLPKGDYSIRAWALLIGQQDYDGNCGDSLCEPVRLHGSTVELRSTTDRVADDEMQGVSWAFRPVTQDSWVEIGLSVTGRGLTTAASRGTSGAAIDAWTATMRDNLLESATDERITAALTSNESNVARLVELLGNPWIENYGTAVLPLRGKLENPLPTDFYAVSGGIHAVTQAQFDAVCKKPGALPCTKRETPSGDEVYVWGYTDHDASAKEVRGERAVYFVRPNGLILLASLNLTGRNVSEAQADEQVAAAQLWLQRFDDKLIAAATHRQMQFGQAT